MIPTPFRVLDRLRHGHPPSAREVRAAVAGATDGSWSDAQLGAFLMAVAVRDLDRTAVRDLTVAMRDSGECWALAADFPRLVDKHSTGGVGDTVSLVLGPLLAACGVPVVMVTGRGLGHTMGTTDKLEALPGISLEHERPAVVRLLARHGLAILTSTPELAPADRRLYALRDQTATIGSVPLITASILSKKLATGAAGIVFDVKTGSGAFLTDAGEARRLATDLVATCHDLGMPATARLTDMSQPLGEWAGHTAELRATFDCLEGRGEPNLMTVTLTLAREVAALIGEPLAGETLERAIADGRARELFVRWAEAQGGDPGWLVAPRFELAPVEAVVEAPRDGVLAAIDTRQLGLLLAEAGGGRLGPEPIDLGVALRTMARLGHRLGKGDEIARLHLRREDPDLVTRFAACYTLAEAGVVPPLLGERLAETV